MKILIIHPRLQPPGGGESVGAWAIQALQDDHELTLAVTRPPDFDALNRYYGTAIDPARVRVKLLPPLLRALIDLQPTPAALLEGAVHYRWARSLRAGQDLVVSTSNEWDFGQRGIQYIHFPRMYLPRPEHDLRWYHVSTALITAYTWACIRLGGADLRRVGQNLTLANSAWTARHFDARHGGTARVLYPPVPGGFPDVPWEERVPGFLIVGRISPEKRVEDAIEIVRRVRAAGHEVRLDVVGAPGDAAYVRRIEALVAANAHWLAWHRSLPRAEFARLLASRRFGLHAMTDEHFGIAVAELLRAGCIPFVPASGGPPEIVGDARLCWTSVDDAVAKIVAVLSDGDLMHDMRRALAARQDLFTTERFVAGLRAAVADFAR